MSFQHRLESIAPHLEADAKIHTSLRWYDKLIKVLELRRIELPAFALRTRRSPS